MALCAQLSSPSLPSLHEHSDLDDITQLLVLLCFCKHSDLADSLGFSAPEPCLFLSYLFLPCLILHCMVLFAQLLPPPILHDGHACF